MPSTQLAPAGALGFDANARLDATDATILRAAGYTFAVRYLPRLHAALDNPKYHDLNADEVDTLHAAGLAVMAVQHVESETSWVPTDDKGTLYGNTAALVAAACGLPRGTTLWLDLEGVADGVADTDVMAYCFAWFAQVEGCGFQAGLYVGWHSRLSPQQLYQLPFTRYWGAYNLNADEFPAVRGICMKQRAAVRPAGIAFDLDADVVHADAKGDLPTVFAPDGWSGSEGAA